jgi:hypothetical protein
MALISWFANTPSMAGWTENCVNKKDKMRVKEAAAAAVRALCTAPPYLSRSLTSAQVAAVRGVRRPAAVVEARWRNMK